MVPILGRIVFHGRDQKGSTNKILEGILELGVSLAPRGARRWKSLLDQGGKVEDVGECERPRKGGMEGT